MPFLFRDSLLAAAAYVRKRKLRWENVEKTVEKNANIKQRENEKLREKMREKTREMRNKISEIREKYYKRDKGFRKENAK